MTNQEMINNVKDNLGNRVSGRIGSRSVDSVVLDALNLALPHIALEAQPDFYNRTCTIALASGSKRFALPVFDSSGDAITIKDIYGIRLSDLSGNGFNLTQLVYSEFVKRTPNYEQDRVGTPKYLAMWGKANELTFDTVTDKDYTLTLFAEAYPEIVTTSDLTKAMPIDEHWALAVEAFATQHCYLKLQQTEMYAIWNDLYLKQKASISRTENQKQSANITASGSGSNITDPLNDPFVRRWN